MAWDTSVSFLPMVTTIDDPPMSRRFREIYRAKNVLDLHTAGDVQLARQGNRSVTSWATAAANASTANQSVYS